MNDKKLDATVLDRLYGVIEERKHADPNSSYTAKMFAKGLGKMAQKLGEEATETVIAVLAEKRENLINESTDLLYHLLLLWSAKGVKPSEVWAEVARREGTSGITEKGKRIKD